MGGVLDCGAVHLNNHHNWLLERAAEGELLDAVRAPQVERIDESNDLERRGVG